MTQIAIFGDRSRDRLIVSHYNNAPGYEGRMTLEIATQEASIILHQLTLDDLVRLSDQLEKLATSEMVDADERRAAAVAALQTTPYVEDQARVTQ